MTSSHPEHQDHSAFLNYPASVKLSRLAEFPFDLTYLNPERIEKCWAEACGYKLLYATEKVTDEVMETLAELAKQSHALEKMKKMQEGEIVNKIDGYPSENRPVLHTATRDFFDQPHTSQKAAEATQKARQEANRLKDFIAKIDREGIFHDLIVIGIGGSDLGPRANYYALQHLQKPNRRVFFISNVDPDEASRVLEQADLAHTLAIVISKSGKTIETAVNEELVRKKFEARGINPKEHFACVTTPGSPMDNSSHYLHMFYMWDWIGGRYSTTSMVGGLVLSFAFGFDIFWELLRGASAMDKAALDPDLHKNLPLLAALLGIWNRNFLHYPTLALIPYSQALSRYPAHIQQVAMESNGKSIDQEGNFVTFKTAPVIWGEPGTNGQHSFFQLIHQGTDPIPVSMVGFKESQCGEDIIIEGTTSQQKLLANLFAQAIALAIGQHSGNPNQFFAGNRPTNILLGQKLTPFALGALLSFYENMVVFQGFIWGINSFDQEGVQLGKVLANKMTDQFKGRNSFPLGHAFLKQL